jgi:hypothetical protein
MSLDDIRRSRNGSVAAIMKVQRNLVAGPSDWTLERPASANTFRSTEDGTIRAVSGSVVKRNGRRDTTLPKTFDPQLDQHEIFEIDRANVVIQLRTLQRAIDESAEEIEMVAIERVFGKPLSRALTRGGQKLRLTARDLNRLLRLVERAHVPKTPGRPGPKPKLGYRRKART